MSKRRKTPFIYERYDDSKITPKEKETLDVIKRWPGITLTELSEYLGRDRTAIGPRVAVLVKKGLVEKRHIRIKVEDGRVLRGIGLYPRGGGK